MDQIIFYHGWTEVESKTLLKIFLVCFKMFSCLHLWVRPGVSRAVPGEIITKFPVRNSPPFLPSLQRGPVNEVRSQSQPPSVFCSLELLEVCWACLSLHLPWLAQVLLSQDSSSTSRVGKDKFTFLINCCWNCFELKKKCEDLRSVVNDRTRLK